MQLGQGLSLPRGGFRKPFDTAGDINNQELYLTPDDSTTLNAKMAASFTAANTEWLSSSSADFDIGDADFSWGSWIYCDDTNTERIISKWNAAGGGHSFSLYKDGSRFKVAISANGTTNTILEAAAASQSTGTWQFVVAVYDANADLLKISVDGATFVTTSHAGGAYASTGADFSIGRDEAGSFYFDGDVDGAFFYTKALSQAESDALHNSGNGVQYNDLSAAQKISLISWWELNETSGNRSDEHGSNTLTDNNTVGFTLGHVQEDIEDTEGVWRSVDQSPNAYNIDQDTVASQPTWDSTKQAYDFDGTDDYLDVTSVLTGGLSDDTVGSWVCWFWMDSDTTFRYLFSLGDTDGNEITYLAKTTVAGQLRIFCRIAGVDKWKYSYAGFTQSAWNHVALVQDGVKPKLYLNGSEVTLVNEVTTDETAWIADSTGADNLLVGANNFNSGGVASFWDQQIAEIVITSDVLTAQEVSDMYNEKLSTYS